MNNMIINGQYAPPINETKPMCPNCRTTTDLRFLKGCGMCYICGHVDYEHKFTEL